MDNIEVLGAIGIAVYGFFGCGLFLRALVTLAYAQNITDVKLLFHVFVTMYCFLEMANACSLYSQKGENVWGYCCHISAALCYIISVMMIAMLWARTVIFGLEGSWVRAVVIGVIAINALAVLIAIAIVAQESKWSDVESSYGALLLCVSVLQLASILLVMLAMFIYGVRLRNRLSTGNVPHFHEDPVHRTGRQTVLRKINSVLLLCTCCYLLRSFQLARVIVDYILYGEQRDHMSKMLYFFVFLWGTFLLSGLVLSAVTRPHPANAKASMVTTKAKALIRLLGNSVDQATGSVSVFIPSLFSDDVILMSSTGLVSDVGTNSSFGHGREILGLEDDLTTSLFPNSFSLRMSVASRGSANRPASEMEFKDSNSFGNISIGSAISSGRPSDLKAIREISTDPSDSKKRWI